MNDYRREIYDLYVTRHLRDEADFSPDAYRRTALFLRRRYRRWLPADKRAALLELGCGSGSVLYWLQQEGYTNVTGIDTSPEQVELARQIHADVREGDLLPFVDACVEQYDLVIALDVLEHFRKEEGLRLARAVHRALRPAGRFLIQTLNADSPFEGRYRYGDLTHETSYNTRSLETLVRMAGFERVQFVPLGPVVHGPISAVRWLLWRLIVLGLAGYHLVETGTVGKVIFTQCFAACAYK